MENYLRLKKSNCQNCYKCIRHCPVKAIKFSSNQAHIVSDECILCGQCFVVCPQNAKEIRSDVVVAERLIASAPRVVVSVAPSFVANFPGATIATMEKALQGLGFATAEETAVGATIVKREYDRMIEKGDRHAIISSCCPTVNVLIQKYYPEAIPFLAPVLTPMQAHAKRMKEQAPNTKVVFVGPCISKKYEADEKGSFVDCVLTFEELADWFAKRDIKVASGEDKNQESRARFFPVSGGILKTMECKDSDWTYLSFDGVDNCMIAIEDMLEGKLEKCFVEMSACAGSCVGGPVLAKKQFSPIRDNVVVRRFAGENDFPVPELDIKKEYKYIGLNRTMPGKSEIESILKKMGKSKPEDELNCSACGYNTCRDKAIAVYFGKADLSMCLPFLKEKAESFSDTIIKNTPNAIIVLNEALEVQQINAAARKILNIRNASDILGDQVIRILDPKAFLDVMETGRAIRDERIYLAEYQRYVEQSIVYDRSYHILMCIMRDVTDEEKERRKKEKISKHTVEVTDRVIEKQMRVVQEIASLLGETTAETKIALTKLKDSLSDE